ncbi:MAG: tyrosine recombinase XerC [Hyphomicrobiales bacterium]
MGVALLGYDALGKPTRKYVSAKTRTEVVQKLKKIHRQIDDGMPVTDTGLKVTQLFERWHDDVLRHQVGLAASSNYKSVADNHIVPVLGHKKVVDLRVTDVDRLLSKKTDSGLSVSTVRRIRSVFAQCLDQGVRWGVVNQNVATLSRAPREARKEGRTLTPDQAKHLIEYLEGKRNEALWALMLSTGLRRGEALGLMWKDFDREAGVLRVRRALKREGGQLVVSDTKTARSRRAVNLPTSMLELLLVHEQRQLLEKQALGRSWTDSGHIFVSSVGTPIDPRNLYREFQKICQDAGLGAWHPHELRHSAASLMLAQGVKIQVVSQVLGHASIRMTADVYGHILDPDREEAAKAMGTMLWGESDQ